MEERRADNEAALLRGGARPWPPVAWISMLPKARPVSARPGRPRRMPCLYIPNGAHWPSSGRPDRGGPASISPPGDPRAMARYTKTDGLTA